MKHLTADQVLTIRRLRSGSTLSIRAIGRAVRVSVGTVAYWLAQKSSKLPGATQRAPPKADAKAIKARRALVKKLAKATEKRNNRVYPKHASTNAIRSVLQKQHDVHVSRMTVYNDLVALGFNNRVRPRVPCTDQADFARRLSFACRVIKRGLRGQDIIFSDEKLFTTNDYCGRTMWVKDGDHPLPRENARWPTKLMVWGAIGHGYRCLKILRNRGGSDQEGARLTSATYKRRILQGEVVEHLRTAGKVFMQDGAACHTAGATMRYLEGKDVEVLTGWPARSPDLNPIERLWAILQLRVSRHHPHSMDDLEAAVVEEWNKLQTSTIDGVIDDFDTRVRTVKAVDGGWPTGRHR